MPAQTRIGDIGIGVCPCHKSPVGYVTVFSTGASSVQTNNLTSCIVGSIGIASCGHPTVALTGSPNVFHENSAAHRIGDVGANCGPYTVVSGSPNVYENEPGGGSSPGAVVSVSVAPPEGFQPTATPQQIIQSLNEDTPSTPYTASERAYLKANGVDPDAPAKPTEGKVEVPPTPVIPGVPVSCTTTTAITSAITLSPHYTLNSLTNTVVSRATLQAINHQKYGALSAQQVLCNLQHLCTNVLEPLLTRYGSKMIITSGLRNGTGGSQHIAGMAADLQFPSEFGVQSYKLKNYMDRAKEIIAMVPYDQFILEYGSSGPIFHVSFNPNGNRPSGTSFKIATRPSLNNGQGSFLDGLHYLPS